MTVAGRVECGAHGVYAEGILGCPDCAAALTSVIEEMYRLAKAGQAHTVDLAATFDYMHLLHLGVRMDGQSASAPAPGKVWERCPLCTATGKKPSGEYCTCAMGHDLKREELRRPCWDVLVEPEVDDGDSGQDEYPCE